MKTEICKDCLYVTRDNHGDKICRKTGYSIQLADYCPIGVTMKDIELINHLEEQDEKYGFLYLQ